VGKNGGGGQNIHWLGRVPLRFGIPAGVVALVAVWSWIRRWTLVSHAAHRMEDPRRLFQKGRAGSTSFAQGNAQNGYLGRANRKIRLAALPMAFGMVAMDPPLPAEGILPSQATFEKA